MSLATLGLMSILLFGAGPAPGQITNVTDTDPPQPGSLREQVDTSLSGEIIPVRIDDMDDTARIDLRTTITFDNDVTLDNSSTFFSLVNIEAPEENSLFEIEDGVDVVLRDLGLIDNGASSEDDINLQGATSTLTLDVERGNQFVAGDIIGSGSLIKTGTASLQLRGRNEFTGGLTILDGDVVGDPISLNTSVIDLAPDAATKSSRIVYDMTGSASIGPTGPMITDSSTNGGSVLFLKQGSGSLDISGAMIDSTIGIRVAEGSIIAGANNFADGHAFTIDADATLNLSNVLAAVSSSSSLTEQALSSRTPHR